MLILKIAKAILSRKRYTQVFMCGLLFSMVLLFIALFFSIRKEEIKCYSEQSINVGEYSMENLTFSANAVTQYRDHQYEKYNSVLLTGSKKDSFLISLVHKNALKIENRTKGYDIQIPEPSTAEKIQYFLVIEINEGKTASVIVQNRGWQVNSDILSLFKNKLTLKVQTDFRSFLLQEMCFNKIKVSCSEKSISEIMNVFWNINNMYHHSLGTYFYWIKGEKAIFLSSLAPFVIVTGVFLLFLEFITEGDFKCRITKEKSYVLLLSSVAPVSSFLFLNLKYCEIFFLFSVLVILHFPVAIILAVTKILLFFYWIAFSRGKVYSNLFSLSPEHEARR